MVAKSGCPVIGHTQVNSGQSNAISYGRSGFGFGKVFSSYEGWVDMRGGLLPRTEVQRSRGVPHEVLPSPISRAAGGKNDSVTQRHAWKGPESRPAGSASRLLHGAVSRSSHLSRPPEE